MTIRSHRVVDLQRVPHFGEHRASFWFHLGVRTVRCQHLAFMSCCYCVRAVVHVVWLSRCGNACLAHQGFHLQLLHGIFFSLRECTSESCEQEQKNAALHWEKSGHPVTSVYARSEHGQGVEERERGELRGLVSSSGASKMARLRLMLMCYNAVLIRTSGLWTLSQHLGPPQEPASNIPTASR